MRKLIDGIVRTQNPTVVGLDSLLDYIPEHIKAKSFDKHGNTFKGAAKAIFTFNKGIIDAICDIVPAIKPQAAYYELYSWEGIRALEKTIAYAKEKGMAVILDGKRNDIGSTMQAYATAHLGATEVNGTSIEAFGSDLLTVNGYLGSDGINPLLNLCKNGDKGIFVLVKTSNPSSGEVQDRVVLNKPLPGKLQENKEIPGATVYETMGEMCEVWGKETELVCGYSAVGAVVGATYPAQLVELREKLPHTFFLVPGYGAQGGGANDVVGAFDKNGLGAIVNNSRGILTAWKKAGTDGKDYAEQARAAAISMRDDIMGLLGKIEQE